MTFEADHKPKRAVVAAVQLPELRQLAKTLGLRSSTGSPKSALASTRQATFGLGKRQELRGVVEGGADIVLVDHEISPSQAHTLEKEVGCEVMDRTMVILVPETDC